MKRFLRPDRLNGANKMPNAVQVCLPTLKKAGRLDVHVRTRTLSCMRWARCRILDPVSDFDPHAVQQ
jgi:hypothetical protein